MNQKLYLHILYVWLAFFSLSSAALNAGEMTDARINIGLKLFRAILAADLAIKTKQNNQNELPILIIYKDNPHKGDKFSQILSDMGKKDGHAQIKGIPLNIISISYQNFLDEKYDSPAGIFLVDKMSNDELEQIVDYGITQHTIIYSPFEHDVKKNITAGLHIGARVHPIVNMKTLKASKIQLKSFFLKVAKKYEP
ncbi:MAG: hypothetical protein OQL19_12990 [Gammaproteobacteria bacterium]|nr:hypothetical protein [Gammaproteobacteria bacterium]